MNKRSKREVRELLLSALSLLAIFCIGCQPIEIGEPSGTSDSSTPVKKSGEIIGNESWSGLIIVEEDVVIPKGSTLTINSGTTVKFSKGRKLIIDGSLYAEGQINQAIRITSAEPVPQPGDWGGIAFGQSGAVSRVDYCVMEYHTQILCQSDSLTVSNSIIAEGSLAGIICDSSSPIIEDNMITNNGVGIRCEGSASPKISYNAITANRLDGIECKGSSFATISQNIIGNNRKNGISCYSVASPQIESNNIIYNGGWAVYGGGNLSDNFIQGNNEQGMDSIEAGTSLSSDQYYRLESISSARSSRVAEAGVRKQERW